MGFKGNLFLKGWGGGGGRGGSRRGEGGGDCNGIVSGRSSKEQPGRDTVRKMSVVFVAKQRLFYVIKIHTTLAVNPLNSHGRGLG